jgi:transcriptional regulator with XRE-family HTH domain
MVTAREPTFAQLLRQHRKAAGISQEELARRALLSRRGISDLERGASQAPRADTVALLADALDLRDAARARFLTAARRGRMGSPARSRASIPRATPPLTPFIGRADELAQIARFLGGEAGEGPPLLLLAGEPGIGKTRLLREAVARGVAGGWAVLEGGCAPASAREPYAPMVEALARHCDGLPPAQLRERLRGCAWLPRLLPELAERGVAPLPQWTLPVEQERRLIVAAVARFLANSAGPMGTLLALDDLQWANPDALDLLAELLRAAPERPLRVIGVYRDTETPPQSPLGALLALLARDDLLARRQIAPLSTADSRELLAALLNDMEVAPEAAVIERVAQRSGGAPFFLVSCARALRAGALSGTAESVPWDAAESVRLRAAGLSEAARRLLGVAAVVGRSAERALVAEVMGAGEEETLALAEAICETRLMREDGPAAYAFTHDIIREAAYGDLSAGRQRLLHQRIAEALARGESAAPPQIIAEHYERAGEMAQAVTHLERAAAQAARAGAYREAKRSLERAIGLAPKAEHRRLYEALGDRIELGLNDTPVPAYRAALALWRAEAQPDLLVGARLARKLFFAIFNISSADQEISREEMAALRVEMRRLAEAAGDEDELWRMRVADLGWYWWTGESGREQADADMAMCLAAAAYFEARGDWEAFNRALDGYTVRAYDIGAWDAGAIAAHRRLAAPSGAAFDRGDATMGLAWAQLARGQYAEAIATVRAAVSARRPGEPIYPYGLAISHASDAARFSGAWSELDALVAWQEEVWEEQGRAEGLGWLGGPYQLAREVALAREDRAAAEQAFATLRHLRPKHSGFADTRGELEAQVEANLRDDPAPLLAQLESLSSLESDIWANYVAPIMFISERGRTLPDSFVAHFDAAPPEPWFDAHHRCMAINRALAADDNTALAVTIDDAEAHGLIPHAARMRIVLAQRTGDRAQLERARVALEGMGDRQFLRKLEAVEAELAGAPDGL